jgi:hypothetical protein
MLPSKPEAFSSLLGNSLSFLNRNKSRYSSCFSNLSNSQKAASLSIMLGSSYCENKVSIDIRFFRASNFCLASFRIMITVMEF